MRFGRSVTATLVALGVLLAPLAAAAQSELALAEVLYQKGRQLMAEGKFAEACPKFAESYRLDAGTGTLLNLASCHEGERKLATAWLEFTEAITSARRDHRDDRVKFAQDHLAVIEPKLSRLTIAVAPNGEVPDLKVQVDGIVLLAAARGVPSPVDPGEHVVEAQAPGRKPWSQRVHIQEQAQTITVTVPLLEVEAAAPAAAVGQPAPPATPPSAETLARPVPTSVYVTGGATVLLAIGAGVTGYVYMHQRAGDPILPEPLYSQNHRWGVANALLTVGTLVGGGVTAYLYLARPTKSSAAASISIAPWIAPSGGGISLGGSL